MSLYSSSRNSDVINYQFSSMTTLLLIDIQKDFHPGGSLAIPDADKDADRTASFIRKNAANIGRIVMTMDSHNKLHIAHPCFWKNAEGEHPNPFTLISMEDVVSGKWIPRKDLKYPVPLIDDEILKQGGDIPDNLYAPHDGSLDIMQYCIEYTRRLEAKGKFKLCIWPEHTLIGTEGHNVVKVVMDAVVDWSHETGGSVEWVDKGQNLLTEMYSALCAEVPVNQKTAFDNNLFESVSVVKINNVGFVFSLTQSDIGLQYLFLCHILQIAKERHRQTRNVRPGTESLRQ